MPRAIVFDLTEDGLVSVPADEVEWGEPEPHWPRKTRRKFKKVFQYHLKEYRMEPGVAHYHALKKLRNEIPGGFYNPGRTL
ncbi:hypothetical protein [Sediminimonas qiaohouensis]|uniref:hypothetical protein n=1 Tax=Sediminimonas qiaohouensis TaxID=552061 RepID=UPI0003FEB82D|nr:hypothetical protein [Sediminimonas qiaohouensis]